MKPGQISKFFAQPYPFYFEGRDLRVISILLFFMILFFNYFFEPFEVYEPEHKMNFFWICVIHSVTPIMVLLIWSSLCKLKRKNIENWNVGSEIVFIIMLFLLIGIAQFLIRDIIYDNPHNWSWYYLYEEVRNTFLVGTLFAFIIIPLNLNYLYWKNSKKAIAISPSLSLKKDQVELFSVFINTQVKNDDFQLLPKDVLYAKADGNYMEIYKKNHRLVEKLVKRITVKDLEAQLSGYPFIMKIHRSYLVNLREVEEVEGNAQGYRLKIKNCAEKIPVSRYMISEFDKNIKKM